ncbi:MAG: hypothetical protein ACRC2T_13380 [Thermoguttaceae bacterium]
MKIMYERTKLSQDALCLVKQANEILREFHGYRVTLRTLFYQFVGHCWIENNNAQYKRICKAIQKGRRAGLIDWDAIEDRTRNLESMPHWDSPRDILKACARSFHVDLWRDQKTLLELWCEKDALLGVIEGTCDRYDVPYLSCRGFSSDSVMHQAAQRLIEASNRGKQCVILYVGDHDPSGCDMTRDIEKRLTLFGANFELRRIALNANQVRRYNLPPNRIKESDTRSKKYQSKHGTECWELDALKPDVLNSIIEQSIQGCIDDPEAFFERRSEITKGRQKLQRIAKYFPSAVKAAYQKQNRNQN